MGHDSKQTFEMRCGVWQWDVSSGAWECCRLRGGASIDQTCFPVHSMDAQMD